MLDWARDRMAAGLLAVAARVSSDPRYPGGSRVSSAMRTLAGVTITPDTAVTIAAVWACLRYLSQTVAFPPWRAMRNGRNGPEIQAANPIDWKLWKRPSDEWSSFQFRETLTHWALRWGNGYAEIEPDQVGRPFAMWPIHPERTTVCRATVDGYSSSGDDIPRGALYYEVANNAGELPTILAAKRMFHIRGFGEGPVGVNVIHYASQSLGWTRAAQLFGAAFFGNGANLGGVVVNKRPLGIGGLERQREEMAQLYGGGPRNAFRTAHLDNGAEFKTVGIDPKNAQLLELHQHLVEEVCRWFGVPPHKVMHLLRGTFSNIEHQSIEAVVDSIAPWCKRFEDEADFKLFGANRPGMYTKINLRALMRGDSKARAEYYKMMREAGVYSVNRILELEDENTIGPDGDKHVMQSQYTTLERLGEEPANGLGHNGGPPLDDQAADAALRALAGELTHAG